MQRYPIYLGLLLLAFAINCLFSGRIRADEPGPDIHQDAATRVKTTVQEGTDQYLVELNEYRLEQVIPIGLSESAVIDAIRGPGTRPIETD